MTSWNDDMMTWWHDDRELRRQLTVWYIFVNQFLQFVQSTTSTSGSQAGGLGTAGVRIIIIMIRMAAGSGERRGRIKQWIIMELTYGIWAAAAPWVQLGSVAHTVTPRPAPPSTTPTPALWLNVEQSVDTMYLHFDAQWRKTRTFNLNYLFPPSIHILIKVHSL